MNECGPIFVCFCFVGMLTQIGRLVSDFKVVLGDKLNSSEGGDLVLLIISAALLWLFLFGILSRSYSSLIIVSLMLPYIVHELSLHIPSLEILEQNSLAASALFFVGFSLLSFISPRISVFQHLICVCIVYTKILYPQALCVESSIMAFLSFIITFTAIVLFYIKRSFKKAVSAMIFALVAVSGGYLIWDVYNGSETLDDILLCISLGVSPFECSGIVLFLFLLAISLFTQYFLDRLIHKDKVHSIKKVKKFLHR